MTPYTHRIIRHGPKNPVQEHNTGQEAGLDPARLHLIDEYVHRLSPLYRGKRVAVHGGSLPRAYQTGERIQAILCSQGVDVGFSIDDLLSPFVGEQGRINLMPARFPRLWGEAQKEGNPDKEDAGLQAWVETGVDTNFDGDGITLREIAYRIGKHILRSIEEYRQGNTLHRISVSHSGFIEPWVYLVLQARDHNGKSLLHYWEKTDGALFPLTGVQLLYQKTHQSFTLVSPQGESTIIDLGILQDQREWLRAHGKADTILQQRLGKQGASS